MVDLTYPRHTSTALPGVSQAGSLQWRVTAPVTVAHGAHKGDHRCLASIHVVRPCASAARRRTHVLCLRRTDQCSRRGGCHRCRRYLIAHTAHILLTSRCSRLIAHCSHFTVCVSLLTSHCTLLTSLWHIHLAVRLPPSSVHVSPPPPLLTTYIQIRDEIRSSYLTYIHTSRTYIHVSHICIYIDDAGAARP